MTTFLKRINFSILHSYGIDAAGECSNRKDKTMLRNREISNYDDVLDSRDVIERIDQLETELAGEHDDSEQNDVLDMRTELEVLKGLQEEAEGYAPDWKYGACLVRDSYWVAYVQEMLEDIGDLPKNLPAYIEIDWEATARNIQVDYTSVEFDGVTYWVR